MTHAQGVRVLLGHARVGFRMMFEQVVAQKFEGESESRANGEQDLRAGDRRVPRIGNRRRHSDCSLKTKPMRRRRMRPSRFEMRKKPWRKGIPDRSLPDGG